MRLLTTISLLINIAVLVPVCLGIFGNAAWAAESYGGATQARGILLSVYFAILVLSVGLLFRPLPAAVAALLTVQIVYKLTTPFTVGTIANPVVVSNLAIAALHFVTLAAIVSSGALRTRGDAI